jgi:hypothetical protein
MPAAEARLEIHFPTNEKDITVLNCGMSAAHRRLSFEELLSLELGASTPETWCDVEKKGIRSNRSADLKPN